MFVASDIPAILQYTRKVIVLEEGEVVEVRRDGYALTAVRREADRTRGPPDRLGGIVRREERLQALHAQGDLRAAQRDQGNAERPHRRIAATFSSAAELQIEEIVLRAMTKISITGCGTAYHAGMVGMYLMRALCKIPVEMELASEFRYGDRAMDPRTLTIAMSQSGETADTIEAVKIAARGRRADHRHLQRRRLALGAHRRRHAIHPRRPRDFGCGDQDVRLASHRRDAAGALPRAGAQKSAPLERLREIAEGTRLLPAAIDVVLNTSDAMKKVARKVRRAKLGAVPGTLRELSDRARRRAQTQGNLLHPR